MFIPLGSSAPLTTDATLLGFPQGSYEAAAIHGGRGPAALEYELIEGARPVMTLDIGTSQDPRHVPTVPEVSS